MRSLLWKEWRENLKWAMLPALLILLPAVLLGGPQEPMFGTGGAFLMFLIAALSGAALGFLQVFFEARGDHRALEALGGEAVDEQPLSLEDALIAYVGRQGDKGFFLNTSGGSQ